MCVCVCVCVECSLHHNTQTLSIMHTYSPHTHTLSLSLFHWHVSLLKRVTGSGFSWKQFTVTWLLFPPPHPHRHENGTVKFWDVTSGAMRLIYEVKTSNLFVGQETESALVEEFSDFKWPPYHKVSVYDPFEDDPRLAIKMIEFCPTSLSLCVGGNGGQVISFSLSPFPNEVTVPVSAKCSSHIFL